MRLEEIQDMWERDSCIDRSELGEESLRVPQLHSKYYKVYSTERSVLRKWENEYKVLYKNKYEYYNGTLSEEELKSNGWEPFALRILKTDIPTYIEADPYIIKAKTMIGNQQDKVDFIESIIKSLPARGYQINSAIAWEKFKVGA
jgi:hypothetical protein